MRDIQVFDAADDCTHRPTGDPGFQESALYVWHDATAGVGGFLRMGQEPNAMVVNCCFAIFTADGIRFRHNVTGVPMSASDRSDTHMAFGTAVRVDLQRLAITVKFPECAGSMQFEDFFPRYDWFALLNRPKPPGQSSCHYEVAGRMTGRICLGGREIDIEALGYRDRSWGLRRWDTLRGTRWWPSVFGPDLCVFLCASLDERGYHGAYGYMIRDGVPLPVSNVDIAATLDYDAISPRSGEGRLTLEDGEMVRLHHQPSDGVVLHVRGYTAVESIGTVRWGGRLGMSNLEVSTNPAGGVKPPVLTFGANNGTGLSRR